MDRFEHTQSGFVVGRFVRKRDSLKARSTSDDRRALDMLYLRVLARDPTQKELKVLTGYIHKVGNRAEAFEDILWSLVNSTEFITRR